jgi:DNA replication protein DnaC
MLIQPTLDTLNQLKLYGMAAALSEQLTQSAALGLPFEDRLGLLVEREVSYRDNRRLTRLLQLAQLKERAALEELDFRARRGLDRSQLASLASCDWIRSTHNLLIHGATEYVTWYPSPYVIEDQAQAVAHSLLADRRLLCHHV